MSDYYKSLSFFSLLHSSIKYTAFHSDDWAQVYLDMPQEKFFEVKKLSAVCRENSRNWPLAHKLVRKLNGAKCRRYFERLVSYQIANNGL